MTRKYYEKDKMQTALLTGYHRCSKDGQTVYAEKWTSIPFCSCSSCEGELANWEYFAFDNHRDPVPLLIGRGVIHLTEIAEIPEVGMFLHLRGGSIPQAVYLVTLVDTMTWKGEEQLHVEVEWFNNPDPTLPIYLVERITI